MIATPNQGTAEHCGGNRSYLRSIDLILVTIRQLFPEKTAQNLSAISKASQRSCEEWISGRSNLSADAVVNLLRSDHGLEFLEAIVSDARPIWWRQFRRQVRAGNLKRELRELQQQLDAIHRADDPEE